MSERIWDKYLSERDQQVLAEGGFWQRSGFGHRPALLVIDVNYNFVGDKPEPILESIKRWPFSCGEEGWAGVAVIRRLMAAARTKRLPIIFTTGDFRADIFDYGGWLRKQSRLAENPEQLIKGDEILAENRARAPGHRGQETKGERVQRHPAGELPDRPQDRHPAHHWARRHAGCVYASVIDAASHNYLCTVVEDACFDRAEASHAMALCDMNSRYADVISSGEVLRYIESLPAGLFELPSGGGRQSVRAAHASTQDLARPVIFDELEDKPLVGAQDVTRGRGDKVIFGDVHLDVDDRRVHVAAFRGFEERHIFRRGHQRDGPRANLAHMACRAPVDIDLVEHNRSVAPAPVKFGIDDLPKFLAPLLEGTGNRVRSVKADEDRIHLSTASGRGGQAQSRDEKDKHPASHWRAHYAAGRDIRHTAP